MGRQSKVTNFEELPLMLTPKEVAAFLRLDETRIYDFLRKPPNGFPQILRLGQKRVFIPRDGLKRYYDDLCQPEKEKPKVVGLP